MMNPSSIPSELVTAYIDANYRVFDQTPFVLKVGKRNIDLMEVHRKYNCTSSTFITGCNPYSQVSSEAQNVHAQSSLALKLTEISIKVIEGFGEDRGGLWPGEPSFLALGVSLDTAKSLGVEFHQNAIVWASEDTTPQLILLR
jgi:hypothetical protein